MRNKQIGWGAIISYAAIAFNILAGLIYTPWMVRTIGDSSFALYTLALSIISLFLLDFGIGAAVTKFLSSFYAKNEHEKVPLFLGAVYKLFLIITIILFFVFLVVYLNISNIYTKLTPDEIETFKGLFLIVSAFSILSFPFQPLNGILTANEKFIFLKICNLLQKVLSVVMIIVVLLFGGDVYSLVLINAFSNIVFVVIKLINVHGKKVKVSFKNIGKKQYKEIFSCSLWVTIVQISQRFIFNIAPTILAIILGSAEITVFSLAATIEGYVHTFGVALSGMFMPRVAKDFESSKFGEKTLDLMVKVGKLQLYLIGLLIIGFICIGQSFVLKWMGVGYEKIYLCAVLLSLPSILDVPFEIGKTTIMVTDNIKHQAKAFTIMAIINIALSIPLSLLLGVYGTALAVFIAYMFRTFMMMKIVHKRIGINIKLFLKSVYVKWLIPAFTTIIFGFAIEYYILLSGWVGVLLKIVLISLVYIIALIAFMSKKEKDYYLGIIKGKQDNKIS